MFFFLSFLFFLALMENIHICCYHHRAKNYTLTYLVNYKQAVLTWFKKNNNTKTTKQFPNYAAAASFAMSFSHEMLLSEPVKDVMKWQMVCLLSSSIKFSCGCALNCFPLFALDVDGCAGWGWFARSAQSPKTREMETERSELLSGVWHNKHNWSQASQRA